MFKFCAFSITTLALSLFAIFSVQPVYGMKEKQEKPVPLHIKLRAIQNLKIAFEKGGDQTLVEFCTEKFCYKSLEKTAQKGDKEADFLCHVFFEAPSRDLERAEQLKVIQKALDYLDIFFTKKKKPVQNVEEHLMKFYFAQGKLYFDASNKEQESRKGNNLLKIANSFLTPYAKMELKYNEKLLKKVFCLNIINKMKYTLKTQECDLVGGTWTEKPTESIFPEMGDFWLFKLDDSCEKTRVVLTFQCDNCEKPIELTWKPRKKFNKIVVLFSKDKSGKIIESINLNEILSTSEEKNIDHFFHYCITKDNQKN